MTPRQLKIARALELVTFPPATGQKRFAKSMMFQAANAPDTPLTEKQARYLTTLAWRYRRQMPADLAYPDEDPDFVPAPPVEKKTPRPRKQAAPAAEGADLFPLCPRKGPDEGERK